MPLTRESAATGARRCPGSGRPVGRYRRGDARGDRGPAEHRRPGGTGEGYDPFLRALAAGSASRRRPRAELPASTGGGGRRAPTRIRRIRRNPDAKITRMKDGLTHLAHKARARGRPGRRARSSASPCRSYPQQRDDGRAGVGIGLRSYVSEPARGRRRGASVAGNTCWACVQGCRRTVCRHHLSVERSGDGDGGIRVLLNATPIPRPGALAARANHPRSSGFSRRRSERSRFRRRSSRIYAPSAGKAARSDLQG